MRLKLFLILVLLNCNKYFLVAQFKISTTFGTSQKIGNTIDSSQFGKKTGQHLQYNAAYYSGRIGIGINVATIQHKAINNFEANQAPNFSNQYIKSSVAGNGIKRTLVVMGPELCLCYKKLRFMPTIKAGVVHSNKDSTKIVFENAAVTARYVTFPEKNNVFGWQMGFIIAYKIDGHLGIALNTMFTSFNSKLLLQDFRKPGLTPKITQPNRFINVGFGGYYNF